MEFQRCRVLRKKGGKGTYQSRMSLRRQRHFRNGTIKSGGSDVWEVRGTQMTEVSQAPRWHSKLPAVMKDRLTRRKGYLSRRWTGQAWAFTELSRVRLQCRWIPV